jgi:hypothetical protein
LALAQLTDQETAVLPAFTGEAKIAAALTVADPLTASEAGGADRNTTPVGF